MVESDQLVHPGTDDLPEGRAGIDAAGHRDGDGELVIRDPEAEVAAFGLAALERTDPAGIEGEYLLAAVRAQHFRDIAVEWKRRAVPKRPLEGDQGAITVGRHFLVFRE